MRFTVVAVGEPRDAALAAAIREYEARASRYWPLAYVEVREEPSRSRSETEVKEREAARLRDALPKGCALWICDASPKQFASPEFARWMQQAREHARDVGIVIGGAFGLSPALKGDATGVISLSSLTLPHELARLVLAEQMYRAGTIVRGEPYHK
jgi:23S rRNA (pseudouridine1915-N3)-methyltransferase